MTALPVSVKLTSNLFCRSAVQELDLEFVAETAGKRLAFGLTVQPETIVLDHLRHPCRRALRACRTDTETFFVFFWDTDAATFRSRAKNDGTLHLHTFLTLCANWNLIRSFTNGSSCIGRHEFHNKQNETLIDYLSNGIERVDRVRGGEWLTNAFRPS